MKGGIYILDGKDKNTQCLIMHDASLKKPVHY